MALIRPVNPLTDTTSLDHIFRTTAGPAFQQEPAATIGSNLFCHPYPILSPETCFVLDSGSGEAVGYILSTPNTALFASKWRSEFAAKIAQQNHPSMPPPPDYDTQNIPRPRPDSDFPGHLLDLLYNHPEDLLNITKIPTLASNWPAHFHIDILPSHQRQGWGKKMIEALFERLRQKGVKGVFLGMEAGNQGAGKFYEAMGFARLPEVLDEGASGEMGRTGGGDGGTIYLVKDL